MDVLNVAETGTFSSNVILNANLDLQDNDKILLVELAMTYRFITGSGSQSYIGADDLRLVNGSIEKHMQQVDLHNGSVN